ncbi:hypothetical protein RJ640_018412 [Escallonia rubra]|uniref:Uncharacterized protein n=1 Tax=Escallonia rubra TaxID=112253 RepID=A0AA88QKF0_9ASTE|nr:hypothetical protein RJ640_018412 [Escallonia rubra]
MEISGGRVYGVRVYCREFSECHGCRQPTLAAPPKNSIEKGDGCCGMGLGCTLWAQMHEKREKLPKHSQDLPTENDILAQVMGKDKYGRVRMYGLGVSQYDVWGQLPCRKQSHMNAMEWKANCEQMEERFNNRIDELKSMFLRHRGREESMYLATLKSYVRNQSRPEGSTSEGYIAEECLTFCSLYLGDNVETKFNWKTRSDSSECVNSGMPIFLNPRRPLEKAEMGSLDDETLVKAHLYVLFNYDDVAPYIKLTRHKEPFVLAFHVQQVFYTEDVGGWHVVIKTTVRDDFDMNALASEDDVETYLQSEPYPKGVSNTRKRYLICLTKGTVLNISSMELENLALSSDNNEDLMYWLKGWNQAVGMSKSGDSQWALFAKSVLDRTRLALTSKAEWYQQLLQPSAEYLGSKLGVDQWAVNIFTEEIIRGGSAASLSSLLNRLDPVLRQTANLGSWQVISPVDAVGYVVVVDELLAVQNKSYGQPTILVAKSVKGEEEIPDGAVAVLTPDMPDVLSHVSVRARNSKVGAKSRNIAYLKGKVPAWVGIPTSVALPFGVFEKKWFLELEIMDKTRLSKAMYKLIYFSLMGQLLASLILPHIQKESVTQEKEYEAPQL